VTCLPTIYKLMIFIISRCMQKYMDEEYLRAERVLKWMKRMQRSAVNFKSNTTRM